MRCIMQVLGAWAIVFRTCNALALHHITVYRIYYYIDASHRQGFSFFLFFLSFLSFFLTLSLPSLLQVLMRLRLDPYPRIHPHLRHVFISAPHPSSSSTPRADGSGNSADLENGATDDHELQGAVRATRHERLHTDGESECVRIRFARIIRGRSQGCEKCNVKTTLPFQIPTGRRANLLVLPCRRDTRAIWKTMVCLVFCSGHDVLRAHHVQHGLPGALGAFPKVCTQKDSRLALAPDTNAAGTGTGRARAGTWRNCSRAARGGWFAQRLCRRVEGTDSASLDLRHLSGWWWAGWWWAGWWRGLWWRAVWWHGFAGRLIHTVGLWPCLPFCLYLCLVAEGGAGLPTLSAHVS